MSWFRQGSMQTFTHATLPASYPTGLPVFVSNVGAKGSHWCFDGTYWNPVNGIALLSAMDATSASINNSETIVHQYQLPAAVLRVGSKLRVAYGATKSGTTDTGIIRVRLGSNGTTGDTAIYSVTAMAASARQVGHISDFRVESATTVLGLPSSQGGYGASSTTAFPTAYTVNNISGALYVNFSLYSSSTNDTVALTHAQLWLMSGA